jgi:hypothetical protein
MRQHFLAVSAATYDCEYQNGLSQSQSLADLVQVAEVVFIEGSQLSGQVLLWYTPYSTWKLFNEEKFAVPFNASGFAAFWTDCNRDILTEIRIFFTRNNPCEKCL